MRQAAARMLRLPYPQVNHYRGLHTLALLNSSCGAIRNSLSNARIHICHEGARYACSIFADAWRRPVDGLAGRSIVCGKRSVLAITEGIMEQSSRLAAELSVSDHAQLGSLADFLRLADPDVQVSRVPGRPGPGEQGALDVLMIMADSSVLVAAVNVLPAFLRSRKRGLAVTVTVKGKSKQLTVTADNAEEMLPILERFLDG
jgi:hypothetical protein